MKKFILPLMVLLFVGSLFAVESAPSEVVGYVKYDLVAGNNTIALPMDQPYALSSEVGDAIGASVIGYFNTSNQLWTISSKNFLGNWINTFSVSNGQPLWVAVDESMSFYSLGALPSVQPTYDLVSGNNTIMVPLNRSDLISSENVGDDIPDTQIVGYFDAANQVWVLSSRNFLGNWIAPFSVSIGDPLWIGTNTEGTWPADTLSRTKPATSKAIRK